MVQLFISVTHTFVAHYLVLSSASEVTETDVGHYHVLSEMC